MSRGLSTEVWPDICEHAVVLVPVGSIEQHGPHLPLDTDTVIAEAVTHLVADLLDRDSLYVAPAISYGSSGEHQSFAGTASVGTEVLTQVVVELTRSLRTWAARVVFVNAHSGNLQALHAAVEQLESEGHPVDWVACATEAVDAHAGVTETSLMLHLRPWAVRLERAEAGNTSPIAELLPELMASGVASVSENGVLGNPTGATAEEGDRVLRAMAEQIAEQIGLLMSEE